MSYRPEDDRSEPLFPVATMQEDADYAYWLSYAVDGGTFPVDVDMRNFGLARMVDILGRDGGMSYSEACEYADRDVVDNLRNRS
jgi:hypothetical protein